MKQRPVLLGRDAGEEVLGEQGNILGAGAERRQVDADDIEAVVEILAKLLLRDRLLEVPVRRGDDADVRPDGGVAADAGELPLLQDAQELALDGERHLADLVEEEGATVALLETADALGRGPGEGTLLVSEEFALEKVLGDRGAVDRKQAFLAPLAVGVDGACDELLAATALAGHQHGGVAHGDTADHLEDRLHRLGLADDVVAVLLDGEGRLRGRRRAEFRGRLEGAVDDHLHVEGSALLAEEIKGAELHRLDHRLGGAEGAHDDHHGVRRLGADLCEKLEPARRTEMEFGDHQIGLLEAEDLEGVARVGLGEDADAGGLELLLRPVEEVGLGVDDENGLVALGLEFHGAHTAEAWLETGFSTAPP